MKRSKEIFNEIREQESMIEIGINTGAFKAASKLSAAGMKSDESELIEITYNGKKLFCDYETLNDLEKFKELLTK